MRAVPFFALVLAACATARTRDIAGEPYTLYWQCRTGAGSTSYDRLNRPSPCPSFVELACGRQRFVVALVDPRAGTYFADVPVSADEMCRRIRTAD